MKAFTLSKEAEGDLDSIALYLREGAGIRVARHVLRELEFPHPSYREESRLRPLPPRSDGGRRKFWSVFSYLIVYDPARRPVEIVRVLHGRRAVGRILS